MGDKHGYDSDIMKYHGTKYTGHFSTKAGWEIAERVIFQLPVARFGDRRVHQILALWFKPYLQIHNVSGAIISHPSAHGFTVIHLWQNSG